MELAALATRAVPGLSPTGVADAPDDARDFMAALVVDGSGNRWRVRGPQHAKAAMRLETEVQVLRGFSTTIRAELPFRVPSVAGATRVEDMRVFVYNHLPGSALELGELTDAGPELINDLGRTVAAVHDLSETVVDHAELPRYSAERLRQRRLNELDAAAATGKVPSLLLRRWEHAMEDRDLWDFSPTVVHGDMHEDNLLIEGERVVAVTGWTDLHIGDPADDLAWLIASPGPKFSEAVLEAYRGHRRTVTDEHILRRAALTAEFALAQWLVRGQSGDNQQMTGEALALLRQLASDIETFGGRPIALTPTTDDSAPPPAAMNDSKPVMRPGAAATVSGGVAQMDAPPDQTGNAREYAQWLEPDTDDEPAVITDADADEDPATEEIPPYVEDHFGDASADNADQRSAGAPETGSLPIQPEAASERRAKQKNYFPASASSASSARSASGSSAASAASSDEAAESIPEASETTENEHEPDSSDSIYSRHPGLRPPS